MSFVRELLRIDDSIVMISEAEARDPAPAFSNVYVRDADESHRRAVEAGARSLQAPSDLPWGDRRGMCGPGGNTCRSRRTWARSVVAAIVESAELSESVRPTENA